MSALRLEFLQTQVIDSGYHLRLDCWKAEVVMVPLDIAQTWYLNGTNIPMAFFPDLQGGGQFLPMKLEMGGFVDRQGRPLKLDTVLYFTANPNAPTGRGLMLFVTMTHHVPTVPNPLRR